MAEKQNWLIPLALVFAMVAIAPEPCLADAAQSKTDISVVGGRFSLNTSLDGLWRYHTGEELGGWIIARRDDERSGRQRSQTLLVAGKKFPGDTTQEKAVEKAVAIDWFRNVLRYKSRGWGDEALEMLGAELRTVDLFGNRFFTHRAKIKDASDFSMHISYYVLVPPEFETDGAYYSFEYEDYRHESQESSVSPLHNFIAGFSLDLAQAPSESTVTWSSGGDEHVVINALERERTFYFNNNNSRQCFAFSADGLWHATDEAGLLGAADEEGFIGVLLLSEEDVQDFEGDDFLSRVASAQQQRHGEEAQETTVETFDCCLPNAIKSTGRWTVKRKSSRKRGRFGKDKYEEILLKRVRYIAEVEPGWAVVVTASSTVGGDDMARSILESLRFSDAPDCFNDEISQLRR